MCVYNTEGVWYGARLRLEVSVICVCIIGYVCVIGKMFSKRCKGANVNKSVP
jgi:hypothetical protein